MSRRIVLVSIVSCIIVLTIASSAFSQQAGQGAANPAPAERRRPGPAPLFFREDWKPVPGLPVEHPIDQLGVGNPNLELKLYGPASKDIQENGMPQDTNNPTHVWTGLCEGPCALAFREKNNYVDLTGPAKIRWNIKVSGFHKVRPLIKLADGTWLVGDHEDGTVSDYHVYEFSINDVRWIKMDINKVYTRGNLLEKVDLTKVDEIGFADLMPGSGHGDGGYVDVGWVEVYGKPVKRDLASSSSR
ncbi:MAG: hypothetical protein DMG13_21385 [Acidobacteria bacterium]|nr:MAG: hypothetical protein DMG13_21385 [Acidobacteriota bacterium]